MNQLCSIMSKPHHAILLILDGWGIGKGDRTDAIACAKTPVMDQLLSTYPHTTLKTHGEHVGLPSGQMGNSEVGHLNIGAGRIVYQMLARIHKSFDDGSILEEDGFKSFLSKASEAPKIHLMGLVSDGGVHSSDQHLKSLCGILQQQGLDNKTYLHAFLDGRDCDPHSGKSFIQQLIKDPRLGDARLATITGRYYAMDRDRRWERIKLAYDAMVNNIGNKALDPIEAVEDSYQQGITDEFVHPIVMTGEDGVPLAKIEDGDLVLCFNFRTDRSRQITTALTQEAFHEQNLHPLKLNYFTMTEYDKTFKDVEVIFHKQDLKMTMGEFLAEKQLEQLRAAETEKYPHVTYFFSGGRETAFPGEHRIMIPSPKVATYDLQPEMSAIELKNAVLNEINEGRTNFMCVNFANPDMVGHTGVFSAIVKACETVDGCVGELVDAAMQQGYKVMIIADHGNADFAVNEDGSANTAHSVNPVPCIVIGEDHIMLQEGILADVAPTLIKMMRLEPPASMTGTALF